MTTIADTFNAAVDAVIADNTLNRGGFVDAMQTVVTTGLSNAEGNDFCDALAVLYQSLNQINNATYNNLRGNIISDGADVAKDKFDAFSTRVNALPETVPIFDAIRLMDLRAARDEINASITTMQGFKTGQTQQVRDALNEGINHLQALREQVRNEIRGLTGDPDS